MQFANGRILDTRLLQRKKAGLELFNSVRQFSEDFWTSEEMLEEQRAETERAIHLHAPTLLRLSWTTRLDAVLPACDDICGTLFPTEVYSAFMLKLMRQWYFRMFPM